SYNQQGVDEAAGDVKHYEAEDPAHEKYKKQGEKHDHLVIPALLKILFVSTVPVERAKATPKQSFPCSAPPTLVSRSSSASHCGSTTFADARHRAQDFSRRCRAGMCHHIV